ncbi:MAG: hypothetical protein JXA13_10135 [Anaerolineales bacterium]|nr:hypothetical protein [Anaerolineales bacterium]
MDIDRRILIVIAVLLMAASGVFIYLGLRDSSSIQGLKNLALVTCASKNKELCLISFGYSEEQSLINIRNKLTEEGIYLQVQANASLDTFLCETVEVSPDTMLCTGPAIDPGTPIKIFVYSGSDILLAEGSFVIPSEETPQAVATRTAFTETPTGTATATPIKTDTAEPTSTPTEGAGVSYPND